MNYKNDNDIKDFMNYVNNVERLSIKEEQELITKYIKGYDADKNKIIESYYKIIVNYIIENGLTKDFFEVFNSAVLVIYDYIDTYSLEDKCTLRTYLYVFLSKYFSGKLIKKQEEFENDIESLDNMEIPIIYEGLETSTDYEILKKQMKFLLSLETYNYIMQRYSSDEVNTYEKIAEQSKYTIENVRTVILRAINKISNALEDSKMKNILASLNGNFYTLFDNYDKNYMDYIYDKLDINTKHTLNYMFGENLDTRANLDYGDSNIHFIRNYNSIVRDIKYLMKKYPIETYKKKSK